MNSRLMVVGIGLIVGLSIVVSGCAGKKKEDFWDVSKSGKKKIITPAKTTGKAVTPEAPPQKVGRKEEPVSYAKDIQPIFDELCIRCHSRQNQAGDVDLSSFRGVMRRGIVVSGRSQESPLVKMFKGYGAVGVGRGAPVTGERGREEAVAALYRHEPLSKEKVNLIERWIDAGCPKN